MIEDAPLFLARLLHYLTLVPLAGMLLYGSHSASLVPPPRWTEVQARLRPVAILLAIGALIGATGWLLATMATMAGSLSAAADPAVRDFILFGSDFGRLWLARLVFGALLIAAAWRWPRLAAMLAALLLLSLAGTGHTQVNAMPLRLAHMVNDAIHLLAAALWLGGLLPLVWLVQAERDPAVLAPLLHRFSAVGYIAVGLLVVTGVANLLLSAERPFELLETLWGWLLAAKLAAFAGMLALAASNRFQLLARLEGLQSGPAADRIRDRLRHHIWSEQLLGIAVLAIVALLGMTALP
ncbi:CopD family protein [Sphingoaurantiacus capsulatus]|uniref:CopD family protein n=1 Tax=Sphingoaurantiacus capsulatus TaxID=1771310 RepID=A0ABV7XCM1_9SPHN